MKLSLASVYALRALAYLAAEERQGRVVASHVIAQARGIPELFLLKVMRPLVQAEMVRAMKGPQGGYWLAKPAARISVLEVVEAVEGPLGVPVPDMVGNDTAFQGRLQAICDQVTEVQRRQLAKAKVSDLVGGKKK